MHQVRQSKIDFIILDVVLGQRDGMCLAKHILATGYQGKLLFISSKNYSSLSKVAFDIGASGFLDKSESKETIIEAVINISRGYLMFKRKYAPPSALKKIELSEREAMIFHYLAQGYTNKYISEQLAISAKTVSTYKSRILKKHHASSFIELLQIMQSSENAIEI